MKIVLKNYLLLTEDESIKLLKVRNHKDIKRNMLNQETILLKSHLRWLSSLRGDEKSYYYAVFADNKLFGGVNITRLDYKKSIASWGIFFNSKANPLVPSIAAYLLIDRIFNTLNISTLNLEVNKLNINAYNFDIHFGFKTYNEFEERNNHYHLMTMNKEYWNNNKSIGFVGVIEKRIEKIEYKFT
jgi:UDP-4-amino-4,6-dideoxy-N-acetyl-beta-L-altrosamine N-acetyltransferase